MTTDTDLNETQSLQPRIYGLFGYVGLVGTALSVFSLLKFANTVGVAPIVDLVLTQYRDFAAFFGNGLLLGLHAILPKSIGTATSLDVQRDIAMLFLVSAAIFGRGLVTVLQAHGWRALTLLVTSVLLTLLELIEGVFTNWLTTPAGAALMTIEGLLVSLIFAMPSAVFLPAIGEVIRYRLAGQYSEDAVLIFTIARTYVLAASGAMFAIVFFLLLNAVPIQ